MKRTINFLYNLGDDVQEKNLSVGFLIDLSYSMQGEPLDKLKDALLQLLKPLIKYNTNLNSSEPVPAADEVMLMTFGTEVQKICPWVQNDDFDFFSELLLSVPEAIFREKGATALYDGLYSLISEFSKAKRNNEKIIVVFSDGGEYKSKKTKEDVRKLLKQYNNGYITKQLYTDICSQSNKAQIDLVLHPEGDDLYLFIDNFIDIVGDLIVHDSIKQRLKQWQRETITRIRIFSLFYVSPEFKGNKKLLEEFGELSNGKVYDSPTEETIPSVMDEMIIDILYHDMSSVRSRLFRRLNNTAHGLDWFKLISFNFFASEGGHAKTENPEHPVYYLELPEKSELDNYSRQIYLEKFAEKYGHPEGYFSELRPCLDRMSHNSKFQNVESGSNVLITMRAKDILGNSSAVFLSDSITGNAGDYFNHDTNVNLILILLLNDFNNYSAMERKQVYAFLNEIERTEQSVIKAVFLVSDNNKYGHNQNNGYTALTRREFEDLTVELLFSLSYNQGLLNEIIQNTVSQAGINRFIAIGGMSLYLSTSEYVENLSNRITRDILASLQNEEKLLVDQNYVDDHLNRFFSEISYHNLRRELLDAHPQPDLFNQIDTPSIKMLTPFNQEKILVAPNRQNPKERSSIRYIYSNIIEYITYLFLDVKNYVDICHSLEMFESELENRRVKLQEKIYDNLKRRVDIIISGDKNQSSPVNAKVFLKQSREKLEQYIKTQLETKFQDDPISQSLNNWSFQLDDKIDVNLQNIDNVERELRNKIENFPLPWAIKFRYYSLGLLLLGGILMLISAFAPSPVFFIMLAIPFLLIYAAEYKIKTSYLQIQKTIEYYANIHKFHCWRKGFGILAEKIKQLFEEIAIKIDSEYSERISAMQVTDDIGEKQNLEYFEEACLKSIPAYYEKANTKIIINNRFNVSLNEFLIPPTVSLSDLFDHLSALGISTESLENREQLVRNLLGFKEELPEDKPHSVFITFMPPNLDTLSADILSKIFIEEIVFEKKYKITLLTELQEEEKKTLLNLFPSDFWVKPVEKLLQMRKYTPNTYDDNLFTLWRGVVRYEIWLSNLKKHIASQKTSENYNSDYIFLFWKEMYKYRRLFRELLFNHVRDICRDLIASNSNMFSLIVKSKQKHHIVNHLAGFSYPSFFIKCQSFLDYPNIKSVVSGKDRYKIEQLNTIGIDFQKVWETNYLWTFRELQTEDEMLLFITYYNIEMKDHDRYSLFASLANEINFEDLKKMSDSELDKLFIKSHVDKYLRGKRQRNGYKLLFDEEF